METKFIEAYMAILSDSDAYPLRSCLCLAFQHVMGQSLAVRLVPRAGQHVHQMQQHEQTQDPGLAVLGA